jgi:hypothetical protein
MGCKNVDWIQLVQEVPVVGHFEHRTEPLSSIKVEN